MCRSILEFLQKTKNNNNYTEIFKVHNGLVIYLDNFNKVKDFVAAVRDIPGEVTVTSGKYVVDGKSILGIFSLDLTQPLFVEFEDPSLWSTLNRFVSSPNC